MLTVAITFIRINGTCSLFWMREKCARPNTFASDLFSLSNCERNIVTKHRTFSDTRPQHLPMMLVSDFNQSQVSIQFKVVQSELKVRSTFSGAMKPDERQVLSKAFGQIFIRRLIERNNVWHTPTSLPPTNNAHFVDGSGGTFIFIMRFSIALNRSV